MSSLTDFIKNFKKLSKSDQKAFFDQFVKDLISDKLREPGRDVEDSKILTIFLPKQTNFMALLLTPFDRTIEIVKKAMKMS